ncbi:MAG: hypothetical protein OEQ53_02765 [Saprospiraceae bacterium]|nr:hypothetical protein [Saprospiraceae bacterium]
MGPFGGRKSGLGERMLTEYCHLSDTIDRIKVKTLDLMLGVTTR